MPKVERMAKIKARAPAFAVPQTDEAANALLDLYGDALRLVAAISTQMDEDLAEVKSNYETLAKTHQAARDALFDRLQAWAEANRARLTEDGKSKTVSLPAGKISWRLRPPSIRLTARVEDVLATLRELRLPKFIRIKMEVNKEAMLEDPKRAATIAGVKVLTDVEDFIVEPFGAELAEPK
jgi:phage host-nuclease inhibitor protein Gam